MLLLNVRLQQSLTPQAGISMTEEIVIRERNEFDGWQTLTLSLIMTLVGYAVLVGVPVISTAWVELLGFTEAQVGRVAGADLGGLSAGAIVTSLVITRFNRRHLVLFSGAVAIVANYLCTIYVTYDAVLLLRVCAGFGSGMFTAVAVAALGATSKPARSFNLMLFAFAFSQAAEMRILPKLSMNGIYYLFIASYVACLVFIKYVVPYAPDTAEKDETEDASASTVPTYIPWLCLSAIFVTYINIGAYWTYIELASLDAGVPDDWIGEVLVWASLLSVVGCAFATIISNRFGFMRPLATALVTMTTIVGMLAFGINNYNIIVSVFMFNFLWIFIDVYQMSTVAIIDPKGAYASLMPAAQGLGNIIGPVAAGGIIGMGLGYSTVFVFCATAAFSGMLIYAFMYSRLKKSNPELASKR